MQISIGDIEKYLSHALGKKRKVINVQTVRGGAQKIVQKVSCDDGLTCMLYVWDPAKNYVLGDGSDTESNTDQLGESYGAELFRYNQKYLSQLGIRTPEIYFLDMSKSDYSVDFALVEDVGNQDITQHIRNNPHSKSNVLEKLNIMLQKMHGHQNDKYGQLNQVEGIEDQSLTCEQVILNLALNELDHVAQHIQSIKDNKNRLIEALYALFDNVNPRKLYGLIHGELGPDHVFIDSKGQPVLIDIEGATFFDIEYEHSFLEFRFGAFYEYLRNSKLDPQRRLFYKLHLHISYSSGPLTIIKNGFPESDVMRDIVNYNVKSTLEFLK